MDKCWENKEQYYSASMDNDSDVDHQVTSGRLKGIIFNILSEEDASKISATVIGTVNEVSDPALGLPNPSSNECLTCGAQRSRECEGHFGLIKLPYTILNPYFISEVAQILNKICPGCKLPRHHKVKQEVGTRRRARIEARIFPWNTEHRPTNTH